MKKINIKHKSACEKVAYKGSADVSPAKVTRRFKSIILTLNNSALTTGPSRHLKVELHFREPRSKLMIRPKPYHKTSKIRLIGNWIAKAGFKCDERIQVIQMDRMLIILPETEYNH
jgi:hypothetical protein